MTLKKSCSRISHIKLIGLIGIIAPISLIIAIVSLDAEAKKVKQSLKVSKEKTTSSQTDEQPERRQLPADKNSYIILADGSQAEFCPDSISFSGYEKEANASLETLLITNAGNVSIAGVKFKIIYKDIKERMFHSRTVTQNCHIPADETRRIDFKSWDKQKSYFYYLGNEPRKVATPYKVEIVPIAYFIY